MTHRAYVRIVRASRLAIGDSVFIKHYQDERRGHPDYTKFNWRAWRIDGIDRFGSSLIFHLSRRRPEPANNGLFVEKRAHDTMIAAPEDYKPLLLAYLKED